MNVSDEQLMAYADGELSDEERRNVEAALQNDPQAAQRVAAHRALRDRLRLAYDAELLEEVPPRLLAALGATTQVRSASVANIKDARAARASRSADANMRNFAQAWRPAGALAASVLVGIGAGYALWHRSAAPFEQTADGALVARGSLAAALSNQLTASQETSLPVRIGLSFLARSGEYCRSFALAGDASPAGIACRGGQRWQIQELTRQQGTDSSGAYRTAASGMPAAILKAIDEQISGDPLDQAQETAARDHGWVVPPARGTR